jgi:hypothetical protein
MFFFFNDAATTEIYTAVRTLSLHDALPISEIGRIGRIAGAARGAEPCRFYGVLVELRDDVEVNVNAAG